MQVRPRHDAHPPRLGRLEEGVHAPLVDRAEGAERRGAVREGEVERAVRHLARIGGVLNRISSGKV
jgi:hypothetical protein